jgi:uncharacterized protein (TIGR03435 family)
LVSFDVASVKLTQHRRDANGYSRSEVRIASPERFVATNASLDELIRWAYEVREYQIAGPAWIKADDPNYDIEAKAPPETLPRQMRLMVQSLLVERFKLELHRVTKTLPVYALVAGKNGPRLEPASAEAGSGFASMGSNRGVRVTAEKASMERLSHRLSLDLDRPVLDQTGINGLFAITLEWAREGDGPSIFTAIQEQLGLKLESSQAPIEILVIDNANKIPTEN